MDPRPDTIIELVDDVARRASAYLGSIDERSVAPTPEALIALDRFHEPLPAGPSDPAATLALLDEVGSPATMATTGPRYYGFVNGATLPAALAAAWMVSTWDQNAALPVMSPVAERLHTVVRGWLNQLLGFAETTQVSFVTGATMANASALAAARDHQLARAGWDVQSQGLFGAPELTVVVGEKAHSTVYKSLGLVGLGRDRVVVVPGDDQGRMVASEIPDLDGPVVICAQAGEVNTGAFDPFPEIVAWARQRDGWVHVDGAFGLWALADPSRQHLVEGLTDADSWATDGHKWLNVTYDCGLVFVRRTEDLRRTFAAAAGYLPPADGYEAMHHTPQSSQRPRQIEVWAALRSLGRSGVAELVAAACDRAQALAAGMADLGLEVLNTVVLNQVLVRAADEETTNALMAAIQADGTCWCGPTVWAGHTAMRVSVSGWKTTQGDVERSLEAIGRCWEAVL
ncbi:MAG: aspartate aminotransferase family protein [Actinomycetia bacterium]|nr:aspartate aminotransferase family protein [Actinomycetes bacterium]